MKFTVKELHDGAISKVPTEGGIYTVKMPKGYNFKLLKESEGRQKTSKGKPSNYPLSKLQNKIETVYGNTGKYRSDILYIGQTSHNVGLQERVREYIGFRYDDNTDPHDGGRALWQLEGNEDFIFEFESLSKDVDPEDEEHNRLIDFKNTYDNYPFANWKS